MGQFSWNNLTRILAFAATVEVGTGLVLLIDPALVVRLLLGADLVGVGMPVGRCFGVAILALGVACWPSGPHMEADAPVIRAMLIYNTLIAAYLSWLGTFGHFDGPLLWVGVAVHAVVALWLASAWRNGQRRTGDSA